MIEFRKIIKILRKKEEEKNGSDKVAFLPFDFNSLLNYLSQKTQRERLHQKIDTTKFNIEETAIDVKAFNKLFNMLAEDNNDNLDQPIKKQVKLRYEIDKLRVSKMVTKNIINVLS